MSPVGVVGMPEADLFSRGIRYAHTELGQIAAHEGEIVILVELANAPDAIHRRLVADMATHRVGRIRRVDN